MVKIKNRNLYSEDLGMTIVIGFIFFRMIGLLYRFGLKLG